MRTLRGMSSAGEKSPSPERRGKLFRNESLVWLGVTTFLVTLKYSEEPCGGPQECLLSDPDSSVSPPTPHVMSRRNQKVGSTYGDC